jgi:hypothetical protein
MAIAVCIAIAYGVSMVNENFNMIYNKDELLAEIAKLEAKIQRYEDGEYKPSEYEQYKDMLNECYPEYKFGEMTYSPASILESCDPVAFKLGMEEYFDSRLEDLKPELEQLQENLAWLEE